MTNIRNFETTTLDGSITKWVEIDRGNGEFTSMPKTVYDTLASESNPTGGNN